MKTLDATHPHFVRCIIPNEIKTGGVLDAHLVMHQLNCNGVLEGIRICRKGYPSRLVFDDFLKRYGILAAEEAKAHSDMKKASAAVLEKVKLDPEQYRVGLTKVLFKAGILGLLEEKRDEIITRIMTLLQSQMRRYIVKKNIKKMIEQKKALAVVQRNVKAYIDLRNWGWLKLYNAMKHLLVSAKKAEEERLRKEQEEREAAERAKAEAEAAARRLLEMEKNAEGMKILEENFLKVTGQLADEKAVSAQLREEGDKLRQEQQVLEAKNRALANDLADEQDKVADLSQRKAKLEEELSATKKVRSSLES